MSMTPKQKVAAQGRILGRYAARMGEASGELAHRGRQLENASKALDPVAAAGAYHDGIADIVNMLKNAGRHLSRHVLGQDGDAPRFDLADAKISVFISSDVDWPDETSMDDPETLRNILARLEAGGVEAWCNLTVQVEWRGFHGRDDLGGVSLEPGTPVPATLAVASDHGMLGCAVQNLAAAVKKAGWDAVWPNNEARDAFRLADSQAITHSEPHCHTCGE